MSVDSQIGMLGAATMVSGGVGVELANTGMDPTMVIAISMSILIFGISLIVRSKFKNN